MNGGSKIVSCWFRKPDWSSLILGFPLKVYVINYHDEQIQCVEHGYYNRILIAFSFRARRTLTLLLRASVAKQMCVRKIHQHLQSAGRTLGFAGRTFGQLFLLAGTWFYLVTKATPPALLINARCDEQ